MKRTGMIGLIGMGAMLAAYPSALQADPAAPTASEAPIALLIDIGSGQILHSREADRRFLPASMTKVMTAFLAFEMLADGRLKPDQRFTVSDDVFEQWSGTGSTMFLKRGEQVSVEELLLAINTVSANDGSVLLAVGATGSVERWVEMMNEEARKIGLRDSHFGTPNGWPDEGLTFTTASDLARLAETMLERHPQLYAHYFGRRSYAHNGLTQNNRDPIIGFVRGADGMKTGYTREAGYNFVGTAARDGTRLVMVVAGTQSPPERARIARNYLEWGFEAFEAAILFPQGEVIGNARVQGGAARNVDLRAAAPVIARLPKEGPRGMELAVRYRGPLQAPIEGGSKVADLEVRVEGFEPFRVPLEAAESVPAANIWQRIANGMLGWFG